MKNYHLAFFNKGRLFYSVEHEFPDDLEAIALGGHFAADFDVEVWEGSRLVGRLKRGDVPPRVRKPAAE